MDAETQSWVALGVVAATAAAFIWRWRAGRKAATKPTCGGACGCGKPLPSRGQRADIRAGRRTPEFAGDNGDGQ